MKKLTPIRAIRQYCFRCKNRSYISVKACPEFQCSLYPYRLGKRPDPAELTIWQENFGMKMVANNIAKSTQKMGLEKVRKQ